MKTVVRNLQARPILSAARLGVIARVVRQDEIDRGRAELRPGTVGFAFVDDATMSSHHERFRGDRSPTDVLSFPDELGEAAGSGPGGDAEPYWGDVIICTDAAARQSRRLGHPYGHELMVLALHGVLHLLGHDHTRDGGEMVRLEEALRPRCAAMAFPWA